MRNHTITADLTQTVTIGEEDTSGRVVELEFTVIAEMHFTPGNTSGPPEFCEPDDSEYNLMSLKITKATESGKPVHLSLDTMARLRAAINMERVEEQMWEEYQDKLSGADEY